MYRGANRLGPRRLPRAPFFFRGRWIKVRGRKVLLSRTPTVSKIGARTRDQDHIVFLR